MPNCPRKAMTCNPGRCLNKHTTAIPVRALHAQVKLLSSLRYNFRSCDIPSQLFHSIDGIELLDMPIIGMKLFGKLPCAAHTYRSQFHIHQQCIAR